MRRARRAALRWAASLPRRGGGPAQGRLARPFVEFLDGNGLASHDSDGLARLVFLAHDLAIRASVTPAMRYLRIQLFPRERGGGFYKHPTLAVAIARWRTEHPLYEEEATVSREERVLLGTEPPVSQRDAAARAMITSQFGVDHE